MCKDTYSHHVNIISFTCGSWDKCTCNKSNASKNMTYKYGGKTTEPTTHFEIIQKLLPT